MKKDIHPAYYNDATITCACGNSWQTGSTMKEVQIELCSSCHPFFTGKKKLVDVMGRVERFKARAAKKLTPIYKSGGHPEEPTLRGRRGNSYAKIPRKKRGNKKEVV